MQEFPFVVGNSYTKKDIYRICSVPVDKQRGNWDTGSTKYHNDWFIFANVGIPGRTGHDYLNRFIGDDLHWYGRTNSRIGQPSIDSLLKPDGHIYIFYRENSLDPFTFAGIARAKSFSDEVPVQITWQFSYSAEQRPEIIPEEVAEPEKYLEGSTKKISVNIYERNPLARKKCVEYYGLKCSVCEFNFEKVYGELGAGFIHVHHLRQLADIGMEYHLDPIADLRPVCPNCHAMLHRKKTPLSIEDLKENIRDK